ncbi:MAG: hypothetical protein ABIG56_05465 [Candidatus Omnitrophota bacterium]
MNRRAGVAIVLLTILVIVALALAGGLFYLFQEEHKNSLALQDELTGTTTKYEKVRSELEEAKKKVSVLNYQMKETQKEIGALIARMETEKSVRLEAQARIEELGYEFDQQKSERVNLETKLFQAQEDIKNKEGQIEELSAQKVELEAKLEDLKQSSARRVELGTIIVSPEESLSAKSTEAVIVKDVRPDEVALASSSGLEGKVLVVNKDYNFIVINLGVQDGVVIGNEFLVYRKTKYLGNVKIEKVHDSMAAAGFLTDDLKNRINEGDRVVKKVR